MADTFVADCATRIDTLCARWFPGPIATPPPPPAPTVTVVRPREVPALAVVAVALFAAIVAVLAHHLWIAACVERRDA